MTKHRAHPVRKDPTAPDRNSRSLRYGIRVLKLDNPGAGSHFFVADEGRTLVPSQELAAGMSEADAKSILLSTPFHKLVLTLDGVLESQVLKLW